MSVFVANMKHFYQCRLMWVFYVFLLPALIFFLYYPIRLERISVLYFGTSFFFGALTADLQKSVLTKPFSFCMPARRTTPRRVILAIAAIYNLPLAIKFLAHQESVFPHALFVAFALIATGMIYFLAAASVVFVLKNIQFVVYVWVIFMAMGFFDFDELLNRILISSPLHVIIAGTAACVLAWQWVGRESHARELCGRNIYSFTDSSVGGWDFRRAWKYQEKKAVEKLSKRGSAISDRLGEFFVERMQKCRALSLTRYLLGDCYIILGRMFGPWWRLYALFLIGLTPICGYLHAFGMRNYFYVLPVFFTLQFDLIPHRTMLMPAGRTEKYRVALISGFSLTLLATIGMATLAAMSGWLSPVIPEIIVKDVAYVFHAIDPLGCYLILFLMPIAFIACTLFPGNYLARLIVIVLALQIGIGFGGFRDMPLLHSVIGWSGVILLIAASWLVFAGSVVYYCLRRTLVVRG